MLHTRSVTQRSHTGSAWTSHNPVVDLGDQLDSTLARDTLPFEVARVCHPFGLGRWGVRGNLLLRGIGFAIACAVVSGLARPWLDGIFAPVAYVLAFGLLIISISGIALEAPRLAAALWRSLDRIWYPLILVLWTVVLAYVATAVMPGADRLDRLECLITAFATSWMIKCAYSPGRVGGMRARDRGRKIAWFTNQWLWILGAWVVVFGVAAFVPWSGDPEGMRGQFIWIFGIVLSLIASVTAINRRRRHLYAKAVSAIDKTLHRHSARRSGGTGSP